MIICEIGQNFVGKMDLAKRLIKLAKENGGDLCKFQLYQHGSLYKAHPWIPNCELSFDQAKMLFDYGNKIGMEIFFSVFDIERLEWCEKIGVKRYKIAALNNDKALWEAIHRTGKPCFISYDPDYDKWGWPDNWQVLYCKSQYPTPLSALQFDAGMFEDVGGLGGSDDGRREYHMEYDGFSDHAIELDASRIALARGAKIIEKHFAINHETGIDAPWSMTPNELKSLKKWELVCQEIL